MRYAAIDRKTLEANNVKLVLNVSNEKYTPVDGITYQTFDALDEPSFNLQQFFPQITNAIHTYQISVFFSQSFPLHLLFIPNTRREKRT